MAAENEFAWTGPLPTTGAYSGFVKITVGDDGVMFSVRSEGASEPSTYKLPLDVACELISGAENVARLTIKYAGRE